MFWFSLVSAGGIATQRHTQWQRGIRHLPVHFVEIMSVVGCFVDITDVMQSSTCCILLLFQGQHIGEL